MKPHLPKKISQRLRECAALVIEPGIRVDYRVRIQIERHLFFAAKAISESFLTRQFTSFASFPFDNIEVVLRGSRYDVAVAHLLRNINELRIYLVDVTSSDPYVRDERILKTMEFKSNINGFVSVQLTWIANVFERCFSLSEEGSHLDSPN